MQGIQPTDVVWPYLQGPARDALHAAVRQRGGNLRITSALRTLAQQFLLYRWYQQGRCGISLAARPGRSNHESGLAIDTPDYNAWRATLTAGPWRWLGNSDVVHFSYTGGGTVDLSGLSVRAFQRLWNRNHGEDMIDEDGVYGPQTEARLLRSPTTGFDVGACDAEPDPPPPRDVSLEVRSRWLTIDGQPRDMVATGTSEDVFDVIEGQRFAGVVQVTSGADRDRARLEIRYTLDPGLTLLSMQVERRRDGAWVAVGDPVADPASEAAVEVGPVDGGQSWRLRLDLVAGGPAYGAALRGEVGGSTHTGRADVFATDTWRFTGPRAEDAEGWRPCAGEGALRIDPGYTALLVDGCVATPPWARLDAEAVRLEVRSEGRSLELAWDGGEASVELRGDGEPEVFVVPISPTGTLRVSSDAPLALVSLSPADAPPPPGADAAVPTAPDAGRPPEPGADAAPPNVGSAWQDAQAGGADQDQGQPLDAGVEPPAPSEDSVFSGGCQAGPGR